MLKLYGKPTSINVRKVLWTCAELGLTIAHEPAPDLASAAFRALNPNALAPVLDDDGFVLWESNSIVRYLANRAGNGALLPLAPAARARVEQWMDWQATELNNSWRYAFMGLVRHSPAHQDRLAIEAGVAAWNRHMRMLDAALADGRPYVCGAEFTLADIVLGLSTNRWLETPLAHPPLAAVEAWFARLATRPACQAHCANGIP
ncbi:glutathione S-transferase family protein [Massilia sp. TS11]|uniref:glutathione S-transferase family protein n=1 Tax=Massilia sp. TS11 TaxID=2908003 RepID=UPI001EDC8619|nr:glutathione S-transferase N-terminal domain-containing protein [Massilia sp. TS11]MCG2585143.1 glutathione S-transferase N-terminal domain-containing protein [Massilia sp. TS11]